MFRHRRCASAETLRVDLGPTDDAPYEVLAGAQASGSDDSENSSTYDLADSPEPDKLKDQAVVESPPADQAKFGRFLIRGVLGQGAHGKVYRALDPDLGREVALKILKRDVSHPQILRQLRQESLALAQLRHRNILRVFEDGLHGSEYFIVSRFVEARPLSVVLAEERVAPRQSVSWIRDVAEALACAHREGILHRDVKPANILITARSEPLLADFGLALDVDAPNQARAVHGTPAYMAPEQFRGDPKQVGPHSDQYSLAIVLHEVLTGRRPFLDSIPGQPKSQPPALGPMPSDVDRRLEAICLKALSPSPAERYPDLDAMASDLDRWLSGKRTKAKPRRLPVAQAARRHAAFLAAAAVAFLLSILLWAHWRSTALSTARLEKDRIQLADSLKKSADDLDRKNHEFTTKLADQAARFEGERASFRQPLARLHLQKAESFAAGGDLLEACVHMASAIDLGAGSWDEAEKQRVRDELAVLAGGLISTSQPGMWPRFDRPMPRVVVPELTEWLGIEREHPTRRWPARLHETDLASDRRDLAQAVSPGDTFALLLPASIWRAGDGSLVETAGEPSGCSSAAFRADGHTLLIAYGNRTLRFWDATTGKPSGDLVRHTQIVKAAAFAPDGRSALAAGQDLVIRRIDAGTGQVLGELLHHPVPVKRIWFETDSKEFTTLGHDGIERRWDAATGRPRGLPVPQGQSVTKIASSPDRRSLLKVIRGAASGLQSGQLWDREGHPLGPPFPMFSLPEATSEISQDGEAILAGAVRGPLIARLAISPSAGREDARRRFSDSLQSGWSRGSDGRARRQSPSLGRLVPSAAGPGLPGSPIDHRLEPKGRSGRNPRAGRRREPLVDDPG